MSNLVPSLYAVFKSFNPVPNSCLSLCLVRYEVGTKLGLRRAFSLCHITIVYFYATDKQKFVVVWICCGLMVCCWLVEGRFVRLCFKVIVISIKYKSKKKFIVTSHGNRFCYKGNKNDTQK